MNILILSEIFYPHGSGGQLATYLYARLLANSGFDIVIVTNRYPGEKRKTESENWTTYRVPLFEHTRSIKYAALSRFDVLSAGFMRQLFQWADIVYIPLYWYSAIPLAKFYGKPVVLHLHDYIAICPLATSYNYSRNRTCDSALCRVGCIAAFETARGASFPEVLASSFLNSTIWWPVQRLIMMSDAVVCVSRSQRDVIVRRMPFIAKKCHVVHNPLPEVTRIAIKGGDMGYFGGPNVLKGFNVLCSALKQTESELTIHMTGFPNGIENMGHCQAVFHERFERFGEKFLELYEHISTVIVPSISPEPSPFVVSEALLNCRLVLASEIGGIPELVEDCPGAYLFRPGDSERLAELIDWINGLDKQTAAEFGARNREVFLRKFNNEKILRLFVSVLSEVVR